MNPIELGLPHRDPFLFVDEVTDLEPGLSAKGLKSFTGSEAFFSGHFPGDPIVPGVILTEALAQLAGIAGASGNPGSQYLLSAVRMMKFPRAALPGELIDLAATRTGGIGGLENFEVSASVGDEIVATGQIILSQRMR